MSKRQIALLRGINVGRAKRVAMAELRAMIEGLGYEDVRTLLNSGNVVFSVPARAKGDPASRIEKGIASELGVESRVMVLTAAELEKIVEENPLTEKADNHSRLLVAILPGKSDRSRLEPLLDEDWTPEALALGTHAAYMWCPDGILAGKLPEQVGRALREETTTRNWGTMLKLHALAGEEDGGKGEKKEAKDEKKGTAEKKRTAEKKGAS